MQFKILSKEEVQAILGRQHSPRKTKKDFPWESLEVGDGFFAPEDEVLPGTLSTYAYEEGLRLRRRFTRRSMTRNGVKGMLIYRTE